MIPLHLKWILKTRIGERGKVGLKSIKYYILAYQFLFFLGEIQLGKRIGFGCKF